MKLEVSQLLIPTKPTLLLDQVKGFCPECSAIINADIIESDGIVYMRKECHGKTFEVLKERDADLYKKLKKYSVKSQMGGVINLNELKEKIDEISAIAIHVTERCNTFCSICVTDLGKERRWENFWTLEKLKTFLNIIKNKKRLIILSGGEPTVRKDLFEIIKVVVDSGNIPYLFTNGIKLADYEYTKKLKDSGLRMIHFSLDSLIEEINSELRGGYGVLKTKIQALKNIKRCGMKVYLSMTVIDGLNNGEIGNMIDFAARSCDFISGIVIRPFVPQGRIIMNTGKMLTLSNLVRFAETQTEGLISKDYLVEFRRFRFNVYRLIRKLFGKKCAKNMSFSHFLDCILKVKRKKIGSKGYFTLFPAGIQTQLDVKPIISYQKLVKMNEMIENSINKSKLKIIATLPRLFSIELLGWAIVGLISRFNFAKILESSFHSNNKIRITFSELSTNINADLSEKFASYTLRGTKLPILMAAYAAS